MAGIEEPEITWPTVEALLDAGAKAPKVTEDLEGSPPVRDALLRREEGGAV